jgi:leukotriene-A4 hydrolase
MGSIGLTWKVQYTVDARHPVLGSALRVTLPDKDQQKLKVKIAYSTTDKCTALGWLEKE